MSIHTFPLENHLIVFRPADKRIFILNPTAGWIWQSISEGMAPDTIAHLLAEQFALTPEQTGEDVQATLDNWAEMDLHPSLPDKENDTQATVQKEVLPDCTLPSADSVTQLFHFHYGQSDFTLLVYNKELADFFTPLLSSLATVDPKTENVQMNVQIHVYPEKEKYVVACNGTELERTTQVHEAVGRVVQTLIEEGFPETDWMAFIHAAAGSLRGNGYIFPAIGGSGKTTLMAALAQSGWDYWADDTVPLDCNGRAGAVPLNHCIKSGSWEVLAPYCPTLAEQPVYQRYNREVRYLPVSPEVTDFKETMEVQGLIFPNYTEDGEQSLQPISAVQALQFIVDSQTWISPDPIHAEKMIHWISTIPAYRLEYNSLDWAIEQLAELVEA